MAVAGERRALITRVGDMEAGLVQEQNVQVKEYDTTVIVNSYMYSKANFYIDQSQKFVGKRKLTRYKYIKWLHWLYIVIFHGSFFTPFHYKAAFVMFTVNFMVCLIYTQHLYVNINTMWYVLKQPCLPDNVLRSANTFLEIQLDTFQAEYAVLYNAQMGYIARERQTVQIQVFRKSTMTVMKNCVRVSTLCFIASLFMFLYCFIWGIFLILDHHY